MRKCSLIIGVLLLAFGALAKDIPASQVPSLVLNQFYIDFPKAKDVDWELDRGLYQVDFELSWTRDLEAWYTAEGKQVKLVEKITKRELPQAVLDVIGRDYKNHTVEDAYRITTNNVVTLKVELERWFADDDITVHFNLDGTIVK
ncbi:MAG: PepSY-like domain-containing protein [Mangrovibacterium sp.]